MDLEMFVVPSCSRCRYLKQLLEQRGLAWQEVDASASLGALRRLKKLTGQAQVPVLVLGDQVWSAQTPETARQAADEAQRSLADA